MKDFTASFTALDGSDCNYILQDLTMTCEITSKDKVPFSFAIVLPMYNEEDCAERAIRSIFSVLDEFQNQTWIIAVNDGSIDGTNVIVNNLTDDFSRLILLTHKVNKGYGGAIKTAIACGIEKNIDYLLFMDSDLTQDPKYIARFLPKMEIGYDIIKGSRYIKGGKVIGAPRFRVFISMVGNSVARLLYRLPIKDYTNGFLAMKMSLAQQLALESNGFEILMEELYQAKFLTKSICEVPYVLTARSQYDGISTFTYRPAVFLSYLNFAIKSCLGIRPKHLSKKNSVN